MHKVVMTVALLWPVAGAAEEVVIAALGDSLTQGYGLVEAEGFVPQLQGWLEVQGAQVQLINAGVSGAPTAGGLSRAAWTLTPEVDAMIVALGGNDLLRGIDPGVSRANLDGILQAAEAAGSRCYWWGCRRRGTTGLSSRRRLTRCIRSWPRPMARSMRRASLKGLARRRRIRQRQHPSCSPMAFIRARRGLNGSSRCWGPT